MVRPAERIDHFAARVIDPLGAPKPGRTMLFSAFASIFSAFTIPIFCATWRLFRKPVGNNVTHEKIKKLFHINVSKKQTKSETSAPKPKTKVEDTKKSNSSSSSEAPPATLNVQFFGDPIAKRLKLMGYDSLPLYRISSVEPEPGFDEPIAVIEKTSIDGTKEVILAFNLHKNVQKENQPDQVTAHTLYINEKGFTKSDPLGEYEDKPQLSAIIDSLLKNEVHQASLTTHLYLKDFGNPQILRHDFAKVDESDDSFEIPASIKITELDLPDEVIGALLAESYEELPVHKDLFDPTNTPLDYKDFDQPITVIYQDSINGPKATLILKITDSKKTRPSLVHLGQWVTLNDDGPGTWELNTIQGYTLPKVLPNAGETEEEIDLKTTSQFIKREIYTAFNINWQLAD